MNNSTAYRRSPLGLFPDQPAPRLYDRVVEVLRTRHYSCRTDSQAGLSRGTGRLKTGRQLDESDRSRYNQSSYDRGPTAAVAFKPTRTGFIQVG